MRRAGWGTYYWRWRVKRGLLAERRAFSGKHARNAAPKTASRTAKTPQMEWLRKLMMESKLMIALRGSCAPWLEISQALSAIGQARAQLNGIFPVACLYSSTMSATA